MWTLVGFCLLSIASVQLKGQQWPVHSDPITGKNAHTAEPSFTTERIQLRDGVTLAVDYFLPTTAGQYPAIVEITPYGRGLGRPNFRNEADYWIKSGYAFLLVDARGTGASDGQFVVLRDEGKDGYDVIEWIALQPWSNKRIGMRGASYSGENQWLTARERPPHLSCITPSATPAGPMNEVPYENGAFALQWALSWIGSSLNIPLPPPVDPHPDPMTWLSHRPLRTLDVYATGRELPLYRTFLDHPTYDDFWRPLSFTPQDFSKVNIPTLAFTGWFDSTLAGTIEHYQGAKRYSPRSTDHFLIIGPYTHATAPDGGYDFMTDQPVTNVGDIPVPENGLLRARDMTRQFFEWCLKDQTRPNWDPIRLFVMESNYWLTPDTFPPEQAHETSLFLISDGHANGIEGNGRLQWHPSESMQTDHFLYDPSNPLSIDVKAKPYEMPVDINNLLGRDDVLVYTSPLLNSTLTVIGDIIVELTFSTTVKDTDLVVQLMDVMPDGRSIKLGSGFATQMRLRYRNGFDRENLLVPAEIYSISINFGAVGHSFLRGHRIRLAITSSFYPWLSANPNTGAPIATDTAAPIVANHTIYYTSERASRIRLMVIDDPFHASASFSCFSLFLFLFILLFHSL